MMYKTGFVVAAAGLAGVSAQGLMGGANVSPSCQAAVAGALTGPAGDCLGVSGLMSVAMTPGNDSLVPQIDSWLTTTCAQPACTNATIDGVLANLTSGCQTDLDKWNVISAHIETVEGYMKEYYLVAREVSCLKDSNNSNKFCVTAELESLEANVGLLSLNNLQRFDYSSFSPNSTLTKNLTCTDCTLAAWNIIKPYISSSGQQEVESQVDGICGSGFASGSSPTSIQKTANTAIQGSSNAEQNGAERMVLGSLAAIIAGVVGAVIITL